MITVKHVQKENKTFWYRLDKHLPEAEFEKKVRDKQGYVLFDGQTPVGILRYNLFWDTVPFCNLIFIAWEHQRKGYGRELMAFWENEMKVLGHDMVMVSTQADETAQHFYRKLGYRDAGGLLTNIPGHEQPMELFFVKGI
ncbi:MAG: GNAT family N-acetyltransferase [Oscillospiraceae bacterium]|nr:GNAT family N-acetyltransferase [Oscillospiraceae bacterium]